MRTVMVGANPRGKAIAAVLGASESGLQQADLVVLCVEDYAQIPELPPGPDVVNLTSGTSEQAVEAGIRFGARYLDGALMAHPEHVGRPETVLVYSGSREVFDRHSELLARLGRTTYLGPDPGTASLYDAAMLNFAWATLIGYLQTATLLGTASVRAETFTPLLTDWLKSTVVDVISDYAGQIDAGRYPGDEEWLELDAPLMRHLITATEQRGLDSALPRLIESLTARGIAAGRGAESFASLVEVIRGGGPRPATT
ncbi:NAD(P)-dependent oxidoreductase [Kibdelosporangium persicum]|uniref:NAD binding domain of 6-phosphogluconate dehydrogenase n=1 Tax=Kibdelosporangium persicum TaxID=2698649 RepID=A0ABX2F7T3_9PSEU|nr:NAD(P)-dependent oxidoreductase [Kibdelosporangium persicum]NRN67419.1 NAD binding domain of 6-phosphogluconate dehydrogenase [Kibdelosporangium persicum]